MNLKLSEYLLIISPDVIINRLVGDFKENFFKHYQCKYAINLLPHITLANFVVNENKGDSVINKLEKSMSCVKPFKVKLKDFGSFSPHTIFVNVATKENILDISKNLAKFRKDLISDSEFRPYFCNHPHVTIARQMTPEQFKNAWKDWENRKFDKTFYATKATLLKRNLFNKNPYKHITDFIFKGIDDHKGVQLQLVF